MNDDNQEIVDENEDLQEFKASHGDPSEIAEPVTSKDNKRAGDQTQGEKKAHSPKTKIGMINAMMTKMHSMKKDDLQAAYHKMAEEYDLDEDVEVELNPDTAITKDDLDLEEDVNALFGMDDLSEDFKKKAAFIFETAVVTKINEKVSEIQEQLETEALIESSNQHDEMIEKLNSYLDYVVENWVDDNYLAVESGIRTEIAEEFIGGLKSLFEETQIDIPDQKVDVLSDTYEKLDSMQEQLNIQIDRNVELNHKLESIVRDSIINESSQELTTVEAEKFENLASNVEFVSEDDFREKLDMIKEGFFASDESIDSLIDEDQSLEEEMTSKPIDPEIAAIWHYVSKSIKK